MAEITIAQTTIPPGTDEVEVTVMVDATAPPGELMIDVEGQAASGPPATGQLHIEVTERENAGDQPATDTPPPAGAGVNANVTPSLAAPAAGVRASPARAPVIGQR